MAKMTKTQTRRALLAIMGKCSKIMDSYFHGTRHLTLADMKKLQKMRDDVSKLYDKCK